MAKRNRSSDSSDASSSDEELPERKKGPKAISAKIVESSDSSSSSSDDDVDWNAKPKAKGKSARGRPAKKPAKPLKRKLKASESEESDSDEDDKPKVTRNRFEEKEEGEVEDNDSDNDDDENDIEEFNDGFDENLMGDEEDQRKLANMTEKEREQELFNRSEKREILKTRFEIERKLRLAKKQGKKKSVTDKDKGKAKEKEKEKNKDKDDFSAFVDSSSRSVERRRNMEDKRKVKDAIKGLKAEREKKKAKQNKLRAVDVYSDSSDSDSNSDAKPSKKATKQTSSSDSSSPSSSSDDDSDTDTKAKSGGDRRRDADWDKGRMSDAEEAEQFNFTIEHLNSIRLSRFKVEQWCHAPFFKDTVIGCFVRIGAGQFSQGSTGYIVGQIVDIIDTPKVYMLGKTKTNKAAKLKHAGLPERQYRLEYISNSEFTMPEFEKWHTKMIGDSCPFPSRDFVERKKTDIQKALNYQFSDADVELIVAEKGKFKDMPVNFAMRKSQLLKDKEYAELNGDHSKAMHLSVEIDRLEDEAKKRDKLRTSNIAAISFINERNRMRNIKEAERAIAEAQKEAQKNKDDPFTRRKCAPQMISMFNKKGESNPLDVNNGDGAALKLATEQSGVEAKNSTESASAPNSLNNGNKSSKAPVKPAQDTDDLFTAHDFDVNIDLFDVSTNSSSTSILSGISNGNSANGFAEPRPGSEVNGSGPRRSLNLNEYKKKKGLI